jgi:photosystem II stability/assembly factor-like uncharacterized protein
MKLKITLITFLLFIGTVFPQILPKVFNLNGNKKIAESAPDISPASNGITDIVTLGDTVWLGTNSGVSLSTDGGASWKNFGGSPAFGLEGVSALGYDKYNGVLWAATANDTNTSSGVYPRGSGLRYTSDNGNTWTNIPQPVDANSDSLIVYGNNNIKALPVTVPIQNVIYDIAFTPNTVWIASWAAGLRKSTDMGKTWQRVILPLDDMDSVKPTDTLNICYSPQSGKICNTGNNNLLGFSIVAVDSLTLYVGTAGGINKTTDGGVSWTKFNHINEASPISGDWVVALAYNSADNTVWAACRRANDQSEIYAVSYSKDGGLSWQTTLPNETTDNFSISNQAGEGSEVIAASEGGLFITNDYGKNWYAPGTITDPLTHVSLITNLFYAAAFQGSNIWIGSSEGLAELTGYKGGWNGTWKIFAASKPLTSVTDTYAYPNPFNPNTDILKIKYSTNGSSVPVTIRIFDFSMHFVRTIIQGATRGNPVHVIDNSSGTIDYWDGRNDKGSIVPNGVYFYRVDAGSEKPVYGKILVLH